MVKKGQLSGEKNPFFGKHHSKETKEKISIANKGKMFSEETHRLWSEQRKGELNSNFGKRHKFNDATKERMSLAHRGKKGIRSFLGKHHLEETKIKIGLSHIGKKFSKEHLLNLSISHIGKKGWKHSEETKIKIGLKHKGKIVGVQTRKKLSVRRALQIFPIKDTKPERMLQAFLEKLNIEFVKHKYINIEHGTQVDIFIPSKNLIIEADGIYWHKYPTGSEIDNIRNREFKEKGFKVLRLWEYELYLMTNPKELYERIECC